VEQPVCHDQEPDIMPGGLQTAQQMVPLQNLVKKDAIKETTQTKTKGVARPFKRGWERSFVSFRLSRRHRVSFLVRRSMMMQEHCNCGFDGG
jgi:hypothetical protein